MTRSLPNRTQTSWLMVGASAALLTFSLGIVIGQNLDRPVSSSPQDTGGVAVQTSGSPQPSTLEQTTPAPPLQTSTPAAAYKGTGNPLFDVGAKPIPQSQWTSYEQIPVKTADGTVSYLNAMQHPVMFMAYWCPHCQNTLRAFTQDGIAVKPDLISAQWNVGQTGVQMLSRAQTIGLTNNDFTSVGFQSSGYRVFYEEDPNVVNQLASQGFPTVVFGYKGQLYEVIGEIPTPGAWGELFSVSNAAKFANS